MDNIQTPTLQGTSNSTISDPGVARRGIPRAVLAIIIPITVIAAAAIVGLATYFMMRRRRLRRKAQRGAGHMESASVGIGPAMEEGLNELGEAPPPYVPDGDTFKPTDHEEIEEVVDEDHEPTEPLPAYVAAMAIPEARHNTS